MNDVYDAKSKRLAVVGVSGTAEKRDSRRYSRNASTISAGVRECSYCDVRTAARRAPRMLQRVVRALPWIGALAQKCSPLRATVTGE